MKPAANYLAIDLGASNGRALLGRLEGARLTLEELHRFEHGPVRIHGRLYWDAVRLLSESKAALARCTQRGLKLDGVGIDTWGVDFALLARGGELLDLPRHYRDPRTAGVMERVFARVPQDEIYRHTGIQFLPLNTLYQLYAVATGPGRLLELADRLLFMPDLLAYWLTGQAGTERCIASTSQMLNARTGKWDARLLEPLGLPAAILPELAETGSVIGPLLPQVGAEVGQAGIPVIRTASHDTAAAVAAVPARGERWAYISSGTWSLVGVELAVPLINAAALAANFTNEAGVGGTTRFLRNVTGLWLVQECQRAWAAAGQRHTHEQLVQMAAAAAPRRAFLDPDDPRLATPGDMPARIQAACRAGGQPVPETPGEVVRCALDSLALTYRSALQSLERLTQQRIEIVHLVGGGVRNELLNQLTADATGRPVIAGPSEATAIGNVLVQAMAQGRFNRVGELREVVRSSVALNTYEPRDAAAWEEAAGRAPAERGTR